MSKSSKKLFIPGPTEVSAELLQTLARPQIGHRSKEFQELYACIHSKLRKLLQTSAHVYLSTSSATGVMEGGVRNLVGGKILHQTCGAFSERWHQISIANGKSAEAVSVEWGKPNSPELLERTLKKRSFDAMAVVHSETSTGVTNPLREISEVMRQFPDTLFLVDAVTSLAVVDIPFDELGIDLLLAGTQKGLGLPSGMTVLAVSEKAMERASRVASRGYYFDFLEFEKYHRRSQTPTTACVPVLFGLERRLEQMFEMGLQRWFAERLELAERCRGWARDRFALFPESGYESVSLTSVRNTRQISVAGLNDWLAQKGMTLSNGYGKLKETTFRIGHMGDITMEDLGELLAAIDEFLGRTDS